MNNNDLELALATGLLAMALWLCRKALFHLRELTILHIAILMTGAFFGLGPWASYLITGKDLPSERRELIWSSYAVVALFLAGLAVMPRVIQWFVPKYKPPTIWETLTQLRQVSWQGVLLIYIMLWIVRMIVAREYGILFSGTGTEERVAKIPYTIVVLQNILEIMAMGCFFWASVRVWERDDLLIKVLSVLIIFTAFVWALTQGRRMILNYTIMLFFCYSAHVGRFQIKQLVYGVATIVLLLGVIFPTFIRMRMSHGSLGMEEDSGGVSHMYRTSMGAMDVKDSDLEDYYAENMEQRPLIIRFIFKIIESQSSVEPMQGEASVNSVKWVIPAALYSGKVGFIQTEQLIQRHYYQKITDTSLTWPAMGCADFGVMGGLLIGVLLSLFILGIEQWASVIRFNHPILAASALGGLFVPIGFVEEDPSAVFCLARALLLLLLAATAMHWMGLLNTSFFRQPLEQTEAEPVPSK